MNALLTISGLFYFLISLFVGAKLLTTTHSTTLMGETITYQDENSFYMGLLIILQGLVIFLIALAAGNILGRLQKADKNTAA